MRASLCMCLPLQDWYSELHSKNRHKVPSILKLAMATSPLIHFPQYVLMFTGQGKSLMTACSMLGTGSILEKLLLIFFFLFKFFLLLLFKYSCLHFHPTTAPHPTHPCLPPLNLPPLALSMCPLYMFLDGPLPTFPHYPSPLPSGYCQFVLYFNVSGYILLASLFSFRMLVHSCCKIHTNLIFYQPFFSSI